MTRRPMLRVAEVAERLAVNEKDVRRLIRLGELEAFDVTRGGQRGATHRPSYRISEDQLGRFLEQRRTRVA